MKNLIIALFAIGSFASAQAQNISNRNSRYQERSHIQHVLSRTEFDRLQETLKKTPFADDKKTSFRTVMQGSFMTVDQLQLLLKQFVFNDDKLDWAILAYPYVIDQKQFYRLRGELTFTSTQEKFDQFMQNMADTGRKSHRNQNVMGRDEFSTLQTMIKKEMFTHGKKNVFKVAMKNRLITVAQVAELIRPLMFDDDKMNWAKLAYGYTLDVNHYYQLRDLFTFDSSKTKLDQFLLAATE